MGKLYGFTVYKEISNGKSKKVAFHGYPEYKQAVDARRAIEKFKKGKYLLQPRENAPFKFIDLGGWKCSKIQEIELINIV